MPEIGEVARVVHFLSKHAVGRTVATVKAQDDDIIFGKVGTSASAFQKAMTGKNIMRAGQQGKYFWLEMSSGPHPVMHLGMTGWIKFSNDDSAYYKPAKEDESWPPRFWKFILELKGEPKTQVAFVDARRLARIRLVDVDAADLRNTTPLKENGPDPVVDKDILTVEWLTEKVRSKRVPIKALLLDQANISGVGNWVADEVMYQARMHPEQYSNTLSDAQIKQLHDSLIEVCTTAVSLLADSSKFPEDWLMKHRWGKGKKDGDRLPNGEKIVFLKVGGRTSAVVPARQKKTGPVAGDLEGSSGSADEEEVKPANAKKTASKRKAPRDGDEEVEGDGQPLKAETKKKRPGKLSKAPEPKENAKASNRKQVKAEEDDPAEPDTKANKKQKTTKATGSEEPSRRRSTRLSRA